jgi:hypothetical protein
VAAWLVAKVNILGIEGLDHDTVATQISAALMFTVMAGLTWLGQSKWLAGHHIEMQSDALVASAVLSGGTVADPPIEDDDDDVVAETIIDEGLPTDAEEAAIAPNGDTADGTPDELRPLMPSQVAPEREPDWEDR